MVVIAGKHILNCYPHNLKVVGSNPTPATKIFIIKINKLQDKAVSKEAAFFAFFNRFLTSSLSVNLTKKVDGHFLCLQ